MSNRSRFGALIVGLGLVLAACGGGGGDDKESSKSSDKKSSETAAAAGNDKKLSSATQNIGLKAAPSIEMHPEGGKNPTVAVDIASGDVYTAYAREVAGAPVAEGEDPLMEAVVARSEDGGKTFGEPVVVSPAGERVVSYTVSPTQVEVAKDGTVYVLYLKNQPMELPGYDYGLSFLHLVTSSDHGQTWSAPVEAASEAAEGVTTSREMATLFLAPDGDIYISFLDAREEIGIALDKKAGKIPMEEEHAGHGEEKPGPATHLRVTRSNDGGQTFTPSVLVSKPTCACCGTKVAEGQNTPLFSTTRSDWKELKGSKDAVRDPFLSWSDDNGATWAEATKIHDDGFKISGCPDVNAGLAVDSQDRLHAAWYTGTDRGPGIYYAISDDDGATFSKPTALLADKWIPYSDVQMVIDDDDRAWVAFEDRRGDVDKVQVVRIDKTGSRTYSKPFVGTAPDLTARDGEAYVVWATPPPAGQETLGPLNFAVVAPSGSDEAATSR